MTINLVDEFAGAISQQSSTTRYGSGELLTLPWSLADGESVAIYVERLNEDMFVVTDRGLAADALALAGVDLSSRAGSSSWAAVKASLGLPPSVMTDFSEFEIAGSASRDELGFALTAVGETVLRADGLRVLGRKRKALSFPDRVIRQAFEHELTVVPRAKLSTKQGGERTVTCKVTSDSENWAFVQAMGAGSQGNEGYDHLRSVFGDANVDREHLIAVIADGARLAAWQERTLDDLSLLVRESGQATVWERLAKAS